MPDVFAEAQPGLSDRTWPGQAIGWMERHWLAVLVAGVVLQIGVLSAMIVLHAAPLVVGDRILLRVRPIDPRDLFRGDYVILDYDINTVPAGGIVGARAPRGIGAARSSTDQWLEDQTVYAQLVLDADGKHYRGGQVTAERPSKGKFIRGKYSTQHGRSRLQYGIEAFYVKEGTGRVIEQLRNSNRLSAEVAVAPWGRAALVKLK